MSTYARQDEDDEIPFDVNGEDEDIDIGDLSTVPTSDAIDTVRKVGFEIKKAELDVMDFTHKEDNSKEWAKKSLKLQLVVGPMGTDGEGRYAGKVFFAQLLLQANRASFPEEFKDDTKFGKNGKNWRPIKEFYVAMGGDPKAVKVGPDWRASLPGRTVIADIIKKSKRSNVNGTWTDTGDFENTIENFKAAEGEVE